MVTSAAAPHAGRRVPYGDNAKGLLVTLVVVGHAIQPAAAAVPAADVLYRFVYLFHMPAFVLVTGVLTAELTARRAGRLVTGLLVPYLVFQALQTLEVSLLRGHWAGLHPLVPRWTLWYLVATVLWRLSAPLWLALRPAVAVAGAVVLALLGGLGAGVGHAFALDDTLGFLPFFVLGLVLRGRTTGLERPPGRALAAGAGVVLVLALAAVLLTRGAFSRSVLQLGFAADAVGTTDARATALRLALLVAATVLAGAVLLLVPRRAGLLTRLGQASLTVYLLHPLLLLPLRGGDHLTTTAAVAAAVVLAVALALVLASRPVVAAVRPLVAPGWADRLLGPRRDTSREPH